MSNFRLHPGSDGVFYLAGELDVASADTLEAKVQASLNGQVDVVLDVADLTFVDSTGIRAFIRLAKQSAPRPLVLRNPKPNVERVLEIVSIETFGIHLESAAAD
jgi:anti-sigma B factor antagonist